MSNSSLSNVVSSLVRASMGTSVPSTVTDEELDKHIAELILKEAKQKAQQYLEHGVKAYLPDPGPDERQPRANKRFLSAIIRNTDDHNKAILRAQAETAQDVRARKEEQERRERKARAKEASEAERLRRLMGSSRRRDDSWDRWDGRRRRSSRDRRGDEKTHDLEKSQKRARHRSRSRSTSQSDNDTEKQSRRRHRDGGLQHSSRSREPADIDGKRRRRDEHDRIDSSRKRRKRSKSRSVSVDQSDSQRRDGSTSIIYDNEQDVQRKTQDKGKGVDRTPLNPENTISRMSSPNFTDTIDKPTGSEAVDQGTSRHQSHSLERAISPSSRPSSPRSTDLSCQFKARKSAQQTLVRIASPTLSEEEDIERLHPRRHQHKRPEQTPRDSIKASSSRSSSPNLSSKMDKYFETSYDPRLDTGPLTLPNVPSMGLVDGSEFEGWEAMLEIIRQRREDRVEKKRLERLGLLPNDKEKREKKTLKDSGAWTMDAGVSVMDIKYNKRGAVREWDMGK